MFQYITLYPIFKAILANFGAFFSKLSWSMPPGQYKTYRSFLASAPLDMLTSYYGTCVCLDFREFLWPPDSCLYSLKVYLDEKDFRKGRRCKCLSYKLNFYTSKVTWISTKYLFFSGNFYKVERNYHVDQLTILSIFHRKV